MKLAEGIHQLTREQYDHAPGVNWSTLKYMAKSPATYRHMLLAPAKDTDARKRGRAAHLAAFEPERFREECIVWRGGARRGNAWKDFAEEYEDQEILTEDEYEECIAIQRAVRNDPIAAKYLSGGLGEASILWTDEGTGIQCKGRVDFVARDAGAIVDLKVTRDGSPEGFARSCWNFQFQAQAAYYVDGYAKATGKVYPYRIVAVESAAPYLVTVYRVPDAVLEHGRRVYRDLLEKLAECRRESKWPGYADTEVDLELPRWAVPLEDETAPMDLIIHN